MFSWRKKSPPSPPVSPGNPGRGHTLQAGFFDTQRSWKENVDLLEILTATLSGLGHSVISHKEWLEMTSGLTLRPQVIAFQPHPPHGVQTTSTIEITHPTLAPNGLFEYQHSAGSDLRDSFASGFQNWADLDLPVFLDALQEKPETCMCLAMTFPEDHAAGPLHRRVVLGPVAHLVEAPAENESEEHPFCPCCLLTNSFEAFEKLLASDDFFGLRLFATRGPDGEIQADCRVNGEDFQPGADALIRYAETWPQRGFEFRKQFVVIQARPMEEFEAGQ